MSDVSQPVGQAVAGRLADAGFGVAACAPTKAKADEVVGALRAAGAEAIGFEVGTLQPARMRAATMGTVGRFGGLHAFVSTADSYESVDFLTMSTEQWTRVLANNLTATFVFAQAAARTMIDSGSCHAEAGRLITVTSTCGFMPEKKAAHYNAAKAAQIGLTNSLGMDLAGRNIVTASVAQGLIAGDRRSSESTGLATVPLRRMGATEEVADVVAFLCRPESTFVTATVFTVDGGQAGISHR